MLRSDDLIAAAARTSTVRRLALGLLAFGDFLVNGALWGYLRTNWRYAGFFLYPYLLITLFAALAAMGGIATASLTGSGLAGIVVATGLFAGLLQWPGRRVFLNHLLDDWIFARDYIRREHPVLGPRLDAAARSLCETGRTGEYDEILVIGHSLGAVLAIDLLARALQLDPALGQEGARLAFLSVGSSVLKIGLHRGATRFRAAAERVATTPVRSSGVSIRPSPMS